MAIRKSPDFSPRRDRPTRLPACHPIGPCRRLPGPRSPSRSGTALPARAPATASRPPHRSDHRQVAVDVGTQHPRAAAASRRAAPGSGGRSRCRRPPAPAPPPADRVEERRVLIRASRGGRPSARRPAMRRGGAGPAAPAAPRSPRRRRAGSAPRPTVARRTSELLFGSDRVPRIGYGGPSTASSHAARPVRPARPTAARTGAPRRRPPRTSVPPAGRLRPVPASTHGADPPAPEHPGHPADVVDVEVADHQQRHLPYAEPAQAAVHRAGSGPASTTTARPGADRQHERVALADRAGHHHPARRRPAGGDQPHRQRAEHRRDRDHRHQPAHAAAGAPRSAARRSARPAAARPAPRPATAACPAGSRAPCRATTHQPPGRPAAPARRRTRRRPARPATSPPPATPSTVAGAIAGTASRFAGTATRLTVPESPATTGPQATWAAAGTASASASPAGTPRRRSPSRQPRREQQQATGGQHGQREPGVAGQLRVDQHQHGRPRRPARAARPGAARRPARSARSPPSRRPAPRSATGGPG